MTHLSWTPISNHVRSGSSQQTKKWRWGLTFHMAFSEMNNLMVKRVWRERCVALEKKKKIQLHIKCAQAFHGLSNLGVICDAWKTCCLISWVMCAHVYVCACMCKRSGRGTHTHAGAVKPDIIWIPPLWWLRKTSQSPSRCQKK